MRSREAVQPAKNNEKKIRKEGSFKTYRNLWLDEIAYDKELTHSDGRYIPGLGLYDGVGISSIQDRLFRCPEIKPEQLATADDIKKIYEAFKVDPKNPYQHHSRKSLDKLIGENFFSLPKLPHIRLGKGQYIFALGTEDGNKPEYHSMDVPRKLAFLRITSGGHIEMGEYTDSGAGRFDPLSSYSVLLKY